MTDPDAPSSRSSSPDAPAAKAVAVARPAASESCASTTQHRYASTAALFLLLTLVSGCYLGHVALGQLRLLRARVPISRVLADPATSDEERERLSLVLEVRDYARDLGLDVGEQYTSFAPWPGDRLVTAVVAARPGSLEPEGFWFPLVGRVPYKSYFETRLASREAEALRAQGLDVCLSAVPAYSTLGWLGDPLTGPLLRAPRTDLVATVIHELVHATVYVRDQPDFNEGLASFVGEEGALAFFAARDGPDAASAARRGSASATSGPSPTSPCWLRGRVAELYETEPPGPARDARRQELERRGPDPRRRAPAGHPRCRRPGGESAHQRCLPCARRRL